MPEVGVAVLGATGVVGAELIELLSEADWVQTLVPIASPGCKTPDVMFRGRPTKVLNATADALESAQVVFAAAPRGKQAALLQAAAKAGVVVVDIGNDFADEREVPVSGLGLNPSELDHVGEAGVVVTPGPLALTLAAVAAPLHEDFGLLSARGTSLMSASSAGNAGIHELSGQVAALFNSQDPPRKVFEEGLAFDLVPEHGDLIGQWLRSELEAVRHASRLLGLPGDRFALTQVITPTFVGLGLSLHLRTETPIDPEGVAHCLAEAPYVKLGAGRDLQPRSRTGHPIVRVGRLRADPGGDGVHLWASTDPIRLTVANAVATVEALLERGQLG